jgi:hypothetical protein
MKTIELPAALWAKVRDIALGELNAHDHDDDPEFFDDGPGWWTTDDQVRLNALCGGVPVGLVTVSVTFPDDLWPIFEACFEVGLDDGSTLTDAEYESVYAGFGETLSVGQVAYRSVLV